jgi:hypothetical protein
MAGSRYGGAPIEELEELLKERLEIIKSRRRGS